MSEMMEDLHRSKKLKVNKVSEFADNQEEKLVSLLHDADKLAQELSAPNENLESLINGLRNEVDSVRAFRNEHSAEYQKLLMEKEQMAEDVRLCLELLERPSEEEQCTDIQRPSFDENCLTPIKFLLDEKHAAAESLKIEKERMRSQANELASLRSALYEKCTKCQKIIMEEKEKAEKLQLLLENENEKAEKLILFLEIEKERTQADELASIRSNFEATCSQYQKLLMDERQKVEESMRLLTMEKEITRSQANELASRSSQDEEYTEFKRLLRE